MAGRAASLYAAAGLFGLVGVIALAVDAGWLVSIDTGLFLGIAHPTPPIMMRLAAAVTMLGDSPTRIAIAVIAVVAIASWRRRRQAAIFALCILGGALLNWSLKLLVMRGRPRLLPHLDSVSNSSFPSGHAANATILYLALACVAPPRWRPAMIGAAASLAIAIGLSRIALAVHWPSDVAAGWCVGIGWMLLWHRHLARPAPG